MTGCCSRCGALGRAAGGSAELVRVDAGFGRAWVEPKGWHNLDAGHWASFKRTEAVCAPCRGIAPPPPPVASPRHAAAAGFRRFAPPAR